MITLIAEVLKTLRMWLGGRHVRSRKKLISSALRSRVAGDIASFNAALERLRRP